MLLASPYSKLSSSRLRSEGSRLDRKLESLLSPPTEAFPSKDMGTPPQGLLLNPGAPRPNPPKPEPSVLLTLKGVFNEGGGGGESVADTGDAVAAAVEPKRGTKGFAPL